MDIPDYEKMRATLLATDDQQVLRLVRVMDPVFRRPKFRPSAEAAAGESDIIAAARVLFPTPFGPIIESNCPGSALTFTLSKTGRSP